MAQLVKRSLPIPEVRSSNPVIGKIYIKHLFTCLLSTVMKSENKSKEAGNGPLLKKLYVRVCANYILIKFLSANIDFYVGMSFFQTGGTGREKNC